MARKFKVGDKVRVTRISDKDKSLYKWIDKEGKVEAIVGNPHPYNVAFGNNGDCNFSHDELELAFPYSKTKWKAMCTKADKIMYGVKA